MTWLLRVLATAFISFTATNIDDVFLLTFFFGQGLPAWRVVAGQYLGFTALVGVSLIAFFARFILPETWIGLLGLLPIMIGIKKLRESRSKESREPHKNGASIFTVAAITFSNGGDNIGVYAPLFATSDLVALSVILCVFFVLLGVWCLAGYFLGRLPFIAKGIDLYGHIIIPFVLIGLGCYILYHNGTLNAAAGLIQ